MELRVKKGRPFYKYTKIVHFTIVTSISRNAPYEVAAWCARISEKTLYEWIKKGNDDIKNGRRTNFATLVEDILEAEGQKIISHLDAIEGGEDSWRGRLAILERRWRKFFGVDAGIIQDLMDNITKLRQDIDSMKIQKMVTDETDIKVISNEEKNQQIS